MSKVLITGGCGYIGSHTIVSLLEHSYQVISADSLINSKRESLDGVEAITGIKVPNYEIDLCDRDAVMNLFNEHPDIDSVIHFAALKSVGESVEKPLLYFRNNINSLINVLDAMHRHRARNFIFSSSCTVYGQADKLPVTEESEIREAESPYGRTKQIGEQILRDISTSWNFNVISLRYFNPAGAHHSGWIGEAPKVEALNLVPVITETAIGKRKECIVFGDDYDTRDGSCVRDYIHVTDLADAHRKALDYLLSARQDKPYEVFNLGIGEGISVLEAIRAFEKVSGEKLNYRIGPRRAGDVVSIYSNFDKARKKLGWEPQYGIEDIMDTAWKWERNKKF